MRNSPSKWMGGLQPERNFVESKYPIADEIEIENVSRGSRLRLVLLFWACKITSTVMDGIEAWIRKILLLIAARVNVADISKSSRLDFVPLGVPIWVSISSNDRSSASALPP